MTDALTVLPNSAISAAYKYLGTSILRFNGLPTNITTSRLNSYARKLRDDVVWKMPILPGALTVYQELAANREWQVSGKLNKAVAAVDHLNQTVCVSPNSGMVYTGIDEFFRRRALDYPIVGRTALYAPKNGDRILEYIDPTLLHFARRSPKGKRVKPNEKVWLYEGEEYRMDEIHLTHALPIGANDLFISPVMFIMPTALLAWLLQEHDAASLDGRKIREILLVGSEQIQSSVETAVLQMLALHAGEDPQKVGIPIVAVNNITGIPLKDQITTLGLSKIPETFDRHKFKFDYVNQIAAGLGLTLRHFWNEEQTTNRALEEVQEQRQMRKGPSVFSRSDETVINRCGVLEKFGRGTNKPRFSFVEEVDSASLKINAEVLDLVTKALTNVANVFQASLSLDALLAWMQSLRVLPSDLELLTQSDDQEFDRVAAPTDTPLENNVADGSPTAAPAAPKQPATPQPSKRLEYDEVSVDRNGKILEKRFKVFSVAKEMKRYVAPIIDTKIKETDFEFAVEDARKQSIETVKTLFEQRNDELNTWINTQSIYPTTELHQTVALVVNDQELQEDDFIRLNYLILGATQDG